MAARHPQGKLISKYAPQVEAYRSAGERIRGAAALLQEAADRTGYVSEGVTFGILARRGRGLAQFFIKGESAEIAELSDQEIRDSFRPPPNVEVRRVTA